MMTVENRKYRMIGSLFLASELAVQPLLPAASHDLIRKLAVRG
jgi:hypothetical protein